MTARELYSCIPSQFCLFCFSLSSSTMELSAASVRLHRLHDFANPLGSVDMFHLTNALISLSFSLSFPDKPGTPPHVPPPDGKSSEGSCLFCSRVLTQDDNDLGLSPVREI